MLKTSTQNSKKSGSVIPSIEEDEEYQQAMQNTRKCALNKAGLYGCYMTAQSEYGERVCKLVSTGRGAYLWGEPGVGKTYAAAHAIRKAVEKNIGLSRQVAWLISSKKLLDIIRDGFNDSGSNEVLIRVENMLLLALDDLGAERPTEWAIETLSALIDTRTSSGLPTIFTSNYAIGELRDLWGGIAGARIASRLGGACERIEVIGEDRRLEGVC